MVVLVTDREPVTVRVTTGETLTRDEALDVDDTLCETDPRELREGSAEALPLAVMVTLGVNDGEVVLETDAVAPADVVRPADGERPVEAEAKRSVGEINDVRDCVTETVTVRVDETDAE